MYKMIFIAKKIALSSDHGFEITFSKKDETLMEAARRLEGLSI